MTVAYTAISVNKCAEGVVASGLA